jgi:hypothetical protein
MADTDREKCEHSICSCLQDEGSDYCSPYCETAGGSVELACNCGHPGCAAEL